MKKTTVGIIGSGVAGMTAAIYLARAGIDCILLEQAAPGGQIINNNDIENYHGFTKISGSDLTLAILKQLKELNVKIQYDKVEKIKIGKTKKRILCSKEEIEVDKIIIATGRHPKRLEVKGEEKLRNKGLSYCAICDGSLYKGKNVLVVGGGNSAMESALYLSHIAKQVILLHRRNTYRADSFLIKKVKGQKNIIFQTGEVEELEGETKLDKVRLKDQTNLQVDGLFPCIGQIPTTDFLKKLNILTEDGYIEVNSNFETKQKGIYAIGDCIKKEHYQIVIAMGEAAACALNLLEEVAK